MRGALIIAHLLFLAGNIACWAIWGTAANAFVAGGLLVSGIYTLGSR